MLTHSPSAQEIKQPLASCKLIQELRDHTCGLRRTDKSLAANYLISLKTEIVCDNKTFEYYSSIDDWSIVNPGPIVVDKETFFI
jgi:hypothetical protein